MFIAWPRSITCNWFFQVKISRSTAARLRISLRSMIGAQRMNHSVLAEELNEDEREVYRVEEIAVRSPSDRACDGQVDNRGYQRAEEESQTAGCHVAHSHVYVPRWVRAGRQSVSQPQSQQRIEHRPAEAGRVSHPWKSSSGDRDVRYQICSKVFQFIICSSTVPKVSDLCVSATL